MVKLRRREVFGAAPERVWQILTHWESQASWMPDVAWMRLMGIERELGARLAVRTKVFGLSLATDLIRVTEWDPPHLLRVDHFGVVVGWGEWSLEPITNGTRLTWTEDFTMHPPWLGEAALRLYGPWQRWMLRRSLRNLKRLVERQR